MIFTDLVLTPKWKAVIQDTSQVLFLEGPSQVSKTTLASYKLVREAMHSPKGQTLFFLAGESTNTLYRNFIEPETGVTKLFPYITEYVGGGSSGGQRLEVKVAYGDVLETKKIFFVGYKTVNSEQKILGSKPYMIMADEFNKAHDQFVRACVTRVASVGTKLIATSNGDTPDLLMYDYLNACRPTEEYAQDVPITTMNDLYEVEAKPNWTYYYFGLSDRPFKDLPDISAKDQLKEWIQRMQKMHPVGSFEYNSKVLGIRAVTEGILYGHLLTKEHDIDLEDINIGAIKEVLCGIDVGSGGEDTSSKRAKTIFALIGYSTQYQRAVVLDGYMSKEIGHLETVNELNTFISIWYRVFNHRMHGIYIDSAEPALINTTRKHIEYPIDVMNSIKSNKVVSLKSRVSVKEQMIFHYRLLFLKTKGAQMIKRELSKVKGLNGVMLDEKQTQNDVSDAVDYAMTPRYPELMKVKLQR